MKSARHGDKVDCWLNLVKRSNPRFSYWYWRVAHIRSAGSTPSTYPSHPKQAKQADMWQGGPNHQKTGKYKEVKNGFVCRTNQNIKQKHDERVFFSFNGPHIVPLKQEWLTEWKQLVLDYQDIHESDLDARRNQKPKQCPDAYLGGEPGKTAWSRHVYEEVCRGVESRESKGPLLRSR